ncbi:MAG: CapA family protein [Ruminococcaceae bacterium]|nr:CapA family protein [Oscillospiraceae bacterium]
MKTLFVGDVCPKDEAVKELFRAKDVKTLFSDTVSIFEGNDINFVNLECALTESENAIEKFGPNLKAPKETAEVLKSIGVTVCGVSNNHIFDFGTEGWLDTEKAFKEAGMDYTGFGDNYEDSRKNYVVEKDGEKVCVITVCEHEYTYALENRMGARPFDCYDTIADVREAKAKYDRVIVIYHGGKEHCPYPSPRLVKLYHALADNGADMILGQHSHCICSYEKYKDSHIFFGQGNFHFVWPNTTEAWNSCLAVKYDTKSNDIEFIPIVTGEKGISLAKGEEKEKILARFEKLCDAMKNNTWLDGWREYVATVSTYYNDVISKAYSDCEDSELYTRIFGHYLDCEAHTDIWRETNKTANETNR